MTERIGAIKLGVSDGEPFLGRDYGHQRDYSEEVAGIVDEEIRGLIQNAHQEAFDILVENREILDQLVVELLERETLLKEDIAKIFAGIKKVKARPAWTGSSTRVPSSQPPVALSAANSQGSSVVEEKKPVKRTRKKAAPASE